MKRIVVLTTGGTIATRAVGGRGATPRLSGADLLRAVPEAAKFARLRTVEVARIPGGAMSLDLMLAVAARVDGLLGERGVDGCIVTHGTDTLEETAFLCYLTVRSPKPVVFVGSMRTSSQVGYDGPRNLLDAVRVACHPASRGLGALVVLNEEVHSARFVTKGSSQKEDAFQSPACGRLGICYGDRVAFFTVPAVRRRLFPRRLERRVDLIRLAADVDDRFLRHALATGARGVVVEAFGGGRVPPRLLPVLDEMRERGVAVCIATRCTGGGLWDPYGYAGAHADLKRRGVLFAHDLPGHKARLKLMLALASLKGEALRAAFEEEFPLLP